MAQIFYADPRDTLAHPNGATGYRTGAGSFDCLGPYAKVSNCPVIVGGAEVARLTCYATGYADTHFSVPACTRYRGKHVRGYFTGTEDGVEFRVMDSCKHLFEGEWFEVELTDTFGGEANYAWVRRSRVHVPKGAPRATIVRAAKAAIGLTSHPCTVEDYGSDYTVRPRGLCQVAFISFVEGE